MTIKTEKKIFILILALSLVAIIIRLPLLGTLPEIEEIDFANTFEGIEIGAQAAYIFDIKTGEVIFALNEDVQLPLASLTKIMSAVVALEEGSEDMRVRTADRLLGEPGGGDIRSGEWWRLKDLVNFSLIVSSNDGAKAIASAVGSLNTTSNKNPEEIFVDKMNSRATELGLAQTYFLNPYGLDVSESFSGAYGTAKDSARLIAYAYLKFPEILETTAYPLFSVESLSGIMHNVENTNSLAGKLPGLSASKTGFTDLAGGNLAIVFEAGPNHPVAIAVLGSTRENRFEDIIKLQRASLEHIKLNYRSNE
jgi:serine-type D-Ala-D-Ala carboxypeptidase (penicillin-binding protein 5/6)